MHSSSPNEASEADTPAEASRTKRPDRGKSSSRRRWLKRPAGLLVLLGGVIAAAIAVRSSRLPTLWEQTHPWREVVGWSDDDQTLWVHDIEQEDDIRVMRHRLVAVDSRTGRVASQYGTFEYAVPEDVVQSLAQLDDGSLLVLSHSGWELLPSAGDALSEPLAAKVGGPLAFTRPFPPEAFLTKDAISELIAGDQTRESDRSSRLAPDRWPNCEFTWGRPVRRDRAILVPFIRRLTEATGGFEELPFEEMTRKRQVAYYVQDAVAGMMTLAFPAGAAEAEPTRIGGATSPKFAVDWYQTNVDHFSEVSVLSPSGRLLAVNARGDVHLRAVPPIEDASTNGADWLQTSGPGNRLRLPAMPLFGEESLFVRPNVAGDDWFVPVANRPVTSVRFVVDGSVVPKRRWLAHRSAGYTLPFSKLPLLRKLPIIRERTKLQITEWKRGPGAISTRPVIVKESSRWSWKHFKKSYDADLHASPNGRYLLLRHGENGQRPRTDQMIDLDRLLSPFDE